MESILAQKGQQQTVMAARAGSWPVSLHPFTESRARAGIRAMPKSLKVNPSDLLPLLIFLKVL